MTKSIVLSGKTVEYDLQIKKVKNINLRVHRDGRVCVSANRYVPQKQIDAFLKQNGAFILNTLERFQKIRKAGDSMTTGRDRTYEDGDVLYLKGEPFRLRVIYGTRDSVESMDRVLLVSQRDVFDAERRKRMVEKFLAARCLEEITKLCRLVYPAFEALGVQWPQIRVRSMVSRWGSCNPGKKVLTFARQLVETPEPCMEYVVTHEFAHFIHPDHSPRFHAFMTGMMPDWKCRKKLLNSRSWVRSE